VQARHWTDLLFDTERLIQRTEGGEALPDTPRAIEGGAVLACAILALVLASLQGPLYGGRSALDVAALSTINAWMAHVPLVGAQAQLLHAGLVELLLAVGVVALWARPSGPRFRARMVIALLTAFPMYGLAQLVPHVDPYALLLAIATLVAWTVGPRSGLVVLALSLYLGLFRIAFGPHFPSDVAGGALLGTALIVVAFRLRVPLRPVTNAVLAFAQKKPSAAAVIGFVLLAQFATGFSTLQLLVSRGLHTGLFR
jgi:hypothetical protein